MDQLKKWVTLSVALSVLVLAAGWFLAVSPKRSEAAELREQAAEQVSANATLGTKLQVLKAQARELPKEQAKLAAVAGKIPADPALPSLVRALLEAADSSGVELVSVAPGTPEVVAPAAPAPVEAPASGQTTPEASVPVDPNAAPPAGSAGQLARISLAVNVSGDYFELQQFVAALERLPRALRVQDLMIAPGTAPTHQGEEDLESGRHLTAQLSGFVFMAVDRPVPTAVTVPGEAAPADATADAAAVTATTAE